MAFVLDLHALWLLCVHHVFHFMALMLREDDFMDVSVLCLK